MNILYVESSRSWGGQEYRTCLEINWLNAYGHQAWLVCNPDSQTACVDEQPLFCTSRFCVDDLMRAQRAVRPASGATNDRILVTVSNYTFRAETPGTAPAVHMRKKGETEPIAAGPAGHWTNGGDSAHLVVVTLR